MPSSPEQSPAKAEQGETIERYRVRARYLAGLVGTGTAAVAAGLVFGSAGSNLPAAPYALGAAGAAFLIVSVAFYAYAQYVTKADPISKANLSDPGSRALHHIRKNTSRGNGFALLASATLVVMLIVTVLTRQSGTLRGNFFLTEDALKKAQSVCAKWTNPIFGEAPRSQFNADRTWIELTVRSQDCQRRDVSRRLNLQRRDITAWSDDG